MGSYELQRGHVLVVVEVLDVVVDGAADVVVGLVVVVVDEVVDVAATMALPNLLISFTTKFVRT